MVNTVTDVIVKKEVSCRVTNAVLKYLESQGYNCDSITDGLPYLYTKEYLTDPSNWVTYKIREMICRRAAELTNDDAIMFKVGLATPTINPLGGVEVVARKLTGPKTAYRFVPKYARLLDRVFTFKTTITGKNTAIVEMRTKEPAYVPSKDSCYFAQGILAAIPTLWGLPPAEIHEIKCMCKPALGMVEKGVQHEAEACVYEVQWQPSPSWVRRFLDNVIGRVRYIPAATDVKELEESLQHIDRKNIELVARNKQLSTVREIATGVDKVKTVDEALTLTVEQAREIEGIRFVLVLTLDESGKYVTTPYYSKIRPHSNATKPLKALGVDPEKLLGKKPTSNKLRFEVSKIKMAQDYLNNPRVMVMPSLADLLDGAMPRTLGNAIQTILRVKKLVMVPLLVENKLWGNILYFLTQEVPLDILEMIGTHCELALNNIINVNNLTARNTELTARNSQLAVVREIALSVDKVQTIDEALSFVVEQAREIDGILFVLVQKLDEAGKFVITPYYSRIRSQFSYMVNAIKTLGFDPEKELGKSPTSNKFRIPLSKLKIAQDILKNPRIMIFSSLREMLDGVWPRILCDSIQKIMGVKKFVLVPLIIEGKYWGSVLYFLTQDVPIDILEMIGAHCSLAIKNIEYMEALATEAVRKRILIDESLDGIVILDENAAVVEANQRFAEMLGYTSEEVLKLHTWDWDTKLQPERLLEMGRTVGSGSQGLHLETQHCRKDGGIIDVDISVNGAVCDGQKLIFCVCRDVTERKKMERALRESEEMFHKAFHSSPEAIAIVSEKDEKYIDINDNYTKMFGYSREELIGKKAFEDNWATPEVHIRMHQLLEEKGRFYNEEFDYRTKSGKIRTRLLSLEPIIINGEPCRIGFSIDITKRKTMERALIESEAKFSKAFHTLPDQVTIARIKDNVFVDVNESFCRYNGYTREEVIGRRREELDLLIGPKQRGIISEIVKERGRFENIELEVRDKTGETRTLLFSADIINIGGEPCQLTIANDITERKKMEQALMESEEKFSKAFQSSPNAVSLITVEDERYIDINDSYLKMTGYSREELVGNTSYSINLWVNEENHARMHKMMLEQGRIYNEEFDYRTKSGEIRTRLFSLEPITIKGEQCTIGVSTDITQRKKAEEALKKEQAFLSSVLSSIQDSMTVLDNKLNIISANKTVEKQFVKAMPLIGKKCYEAYHNRSEPCEFCPAIQTLETGKAANRVVSRNEPDGVVRESIELQTFPIFNPQTGEVNSVIEYGRDVTERRRMIEALQESEERYRTIFEAANDVLILMDNKGKIVDVNDRIKDVGGYDREDFIGKNIRSLSGIMTRKSLLKVVRNFLKRMAGSEVPFYDVEMLKKNRERLTIQINAIAVRKGGKIIGDLAILRDITEIKQAEEDLKLQKDLVDRVLATIPNAVLLLNRKLNVIIANQTFYKLFKLKKSKVEGKPLKSLIVSPDLDQAVKKLLSNKEEKTSTEFRYYLGPAEKILLVNIFIMEKEHLLLVINDVSEEREKQERLYLTDRLVSVGEMAAGVAHEINNPLTSVIGLSSLLIKDDVPDDIKEDLHAIHSEAQRCASIVKNLLTFARKHISKKETLHIAGILADVLKLRAYEQKVNNIVVETALPPDLPEIFADYFGIQQVFINIILNAEAAMIDAHGRGTLKISAKPINNHIAIYFTDDGPGISKENMRSIFNPFFTTKEVGKGTGLGLSICYGIVASHGGKISAKSELGKGTTFVVELPIRGK